jgi:hypothetical protein
VLGTTQDGKLKVLREIADENQPAVVRFSDNGKLYVGNHNGTISIYAQP